VDATDFDTPSELLGWLAQSSKNEWDELHSAGRAFLHGRSIEQFLPEACAEELLEPFLMLSKM
jgi:hypothetical protein